MFTELTLTEMNEIDGGNIIVEVLKEVAKYVIVEGAKAAYKELSRPERYIGKPDYRYWLN